MEEKRTTRRRKQVNTGFIPAMPVAPIGSRDKFAIDLPGGYSIICSNEEEYKYCMAVAVPYINQRDEIAPNYWAEIHLLVSTYQDLFRTEQLLGDPMWMRQQSAEDITKLKNANNKNRNYIQQYSAKLDPLKKKREDGVSATEFLENQKAEAEQYAKEHLGQFTWMCAHCGQVNLMEVPHFAFDSAAGPKVVWNQQIMEMVRKHYSREGSSYDGSLSIKDAARILRVSPIGLLAISIEMEFDIGIEYDLDKPDTFRHLVE